MGKKITRKLIEIEIKLGFLSIPSQNLDLMPFDNNKILALLDNSKLKLTYNPTHRRIFGLTNWYRKHNLEAGDYVIVTKKETIYKFDPKKENAITKITKEPKTLIDISGLSNISKGDIVEDRIKELILLFGQGLLSVYKPVTDTEGIDLIVVKNGIFQPIFLQIKSRFNLNRNNIIANINKKTFKIHHSFYIICAYFNPKNLELFENLLIIPSEEIKGKALELGNKSRPVYRIVSSLSTKSKGKWSEFLIKKNDLSNKLMEKFEEIAKYIR